MGAVDDAIEQLAQAVEDWDFTPAFPDNYPDNYGVIVETAYPWSLLSQIDRQPGGQSNIGPDGAMQQYVITLLDLHTNERAIRLGDVMGAGQTLGTISYGRRMTVSIQVTCWADQRLGGADVARSLGSQIFGCVRYNTNRLPGFKRLRITGENSSYNDGAQLYFSTVTVQGEGIVSVDY